MPRTPFGRTRRAGLLALGAVSALVAVLLLSSVPSPSSGGTVRSATANTGLRAASVTPSSSFLCNSVGSSAPSSVLVPLKAPKQNLSAGGTLTVAVEFEVVNFTAAQNGSRLYVPNLWFKFPLASGATYQIHENASVQTITAPGWTNASLGQKSAVVPGGLAFAPNSYATLTSQLLAVMASATYGNLTIELRWHWQNTVGTGHPTGAWSIPTANLSKNPSGKPTIFEPAPYVSIVGFNATAVIGAVFGVNLTGLVAGQNFFVETEYPTSGKVFGAQGTSAPANATNVTVGITMLNYVHALSPGTYLWHVHDSCGALLWNKSIHAVYAPSATVQFFFQPGTCGPITFNGTAYANGTAATVVPSTVAYNFSIPACKGHTFHTWVTTGGLHIASSKTLLVSASGTFTIEYN